MTSVPSCTGAAQPTAYLAYSSGFWHCSRPTPMHDSYSCSKYETNQAKCDQAGATQKYIMLQPSRGSIQQQADKLCAKLVPACDVLERLYRLLAT